MQTPSLSEVLAWPIEQVSSLAPQTVIYAPGGTRRQAALAGISPTSDSYPSWSRSQMIAATDQLFRHGTRSVIMTVLRPAQMMEAGRYREHLFAWLHEGLAGPAALADYQAHGWRARLIGAGAIDELRPLAAQLREATAPQATAPTVFFYVCTSMDAVWAEIAAALKQVSAATQASLIETVYGEPIEPATIFLGFGKPIIAFDMLPPLLAGEIQAYWTQRPGFDLPATDVRRLWYDYAYTRKTWQADKSSRYTTVEADRAIWQREPANILGVGSRLVSGFWYPFTQDE